MRLDIKKISTWCEIGANVALILGIPAGAFTYIHDRAVERRDQLYTTYNSVDDKYLDYVQMCFDHPYLDVFDVPDAQPEKLSDKQKKEELIAFTMLFAMFERAHIMYSDQPSDLRKKQWNAWDEYIRSFVKRENFRRAWAISGNGFDQDFEDYMACVLDGNAKDACH